MADEPTIAVLAERVQNVQNTVNDVKKDMATKGDQQNSASLISRIELALAQEVTNRAAAVKEVADRLQLVEDRMEARKYSVGIAIAIAVLGSLLGVFIK